MQLGMMSTSLAASGLEETFRQAAEVGVDGLELAYKADNDAKALHREQHADTLNELSRRHGIAIAGLALASLCRGPSLIGAGSDLQAAKRTICQALQVAAQVGAEMVLVPFFGKNTIEIEEELQQAADALLELVEHAEAAGVVLGVESTLNSNQQQFLLNHLGNTAGAKICFDTGYALARKLDVAGGIRDLGPGAIAQVHFRDVRIAEGRPPDFDAALGEGHVVFRAVVQALRAVGYDGWVILETPSGDDPVAAGRKNLRFARDALAARA